MFRIATASTVLEDPKRAVDALVDALKRQELLSPTYLMVHLNAAYDGERVMAQLQARLPSTQLHVSTSCMGAMSDAGPAIAASAGMAAFGLSDSAGRYGTGFADYGGRGAGAAAEAALDQALLAAGMEGEMPNLVWISGSPGQEEAAIAALEDVLGPSVPIIGGSSADNDLSGLWYQGTQQGLSTPDHPGVVISVLAPSVPVGTAFLSGHAPTEKQAVVTKCQDRTILELDGKPARQVYQDWVDPNLADLAADRDAFVLNRTTLSPLGRRIGAIQGANVYLLSHPESLTAEGGITLFTDIQPNETVTLMEGSIEALVQRAARVTDASIRLNELDGDRISGAIIVYCAGCMLTVQDRMRDVCSGIGEILADRPFIGTFTYGEQGRVLGEANRHGNLMISAVVFGG